MHTHIEDTSSPPPPAGPGGEWDALEEVQEGIGEPQGCDRGDKIFAGVCTGVALNALIGVDWRFQNKQTE